MGNKSITFLIRRTQNHAVVAHVKLIDTDDGERTVLMRLSQECGPVPDVSDLIGVEFEREARLQKEIKTRMRAIGKPPASGADRVKAHSQRMKDRKLSLVREWVPTGRKQEFRAIAKQMREEFLDGDQNE